MALSIEQQERQRSRGRATGLLPFEQQPKESAKAFAAFSLYLRLGAERSLAEVAKRLGKSRRMMEKWSRRWGWPARVLAYGTHLADVEREAIEKRAVAKAVEWGKMTEAVRREAWRKSDELLAMADEFLARWRNSPRVPGFESVVRGIELAMRLKQLAAGMPSEIKEVNTTVSGTVDVEWEIALRRAYGPVDDAKPKGEVVDVQEVGSLDGGNQSSVISNQKKKTAGSGVPALPGGEA